MKKSKYESNREIIRGSFENKDLGPEPEGEEIKLDYSKKREKDSFIIEDLEESSGLFSESKN